MFAGAHSPHYEGGHGRWRTTTDTLPMPGVRGSQVQILSARQIDLGSDLRKRGVSGRVVELTSRVVELTSGRSSLSRPTPGGPACRDPISGGRACRDHARPSRPCRDHSRPTVERRQRLTRSVPQAVEDERPAVCSLRWPECHYRCPWSVASTRSSTQAKGQSDVHLWPMRVGTPESRRVAGSSGRSATTWCRTVNARRSLPVRRLAPSVCPGW
jgi:hypothetical protein